ncbi:DUF504 domain-containing protein [Candidatus Nitrosocosmicus franklandus]|uniref:DUF504 domain-containing protein n=1 Tax=Candidatus Nitrosocosmicus franklandianus TaxID=1798806 RepID=A0A484IDN8_9ARCH|nr:DUF504 domain-containing protein [Candidatus Nitrosocosmicus franklandus]VFJ14197.1 conserved protein of unknown function [Candidatus Nitrosocosmicus franklandus]
MVKKGILQEIFSKALYADNPSTYVVTYRDHDIYRRIALDEFVFISEYFQKIPASRIIRVELRGRILYEKN